MAVLFTSTAERGVIFSERFAQAMPDLPFYIGTAPDPALVEYLIAWTAPDNLAEAYPNLKMIFSVGAGVDQFNFDILPSQIGIVRMLEPGIREQMREYTTLAVLGLHRDLPLYIAQQRGRVWKQALNVPASERRVGVMGLGQLGQTALDMLKPFGFELAGWSRTPKALPGVEVFTDRTAFLARTDILICLLPLTSATEGILNAELFRELPAGAALIHAGRGKQLDGDALLSALDAGHLSAAWLDVTDPEPLPESSGLWQHPSVVITPHVACQTRARDGADHVIAGIRAHRAGDRILGLVSREKGY
ncbi:glyoxylate/hydroxypyruvate reductase A [Roseibium sp. HPY-6]|uniref:2-hydroxyacid dehydrogenase n=1 Tax=Roseibium sp. HPY-6 TaxID=3229852 RepID=UPI00338EFC03